MIWHGVGSGFAALHTVYELGGGDIVCTRTTPTYEINDLISSSTTPTIVNNTSIRHDE